MDVKLVMFKSNGEQKTLPLPADRVILGRAEDAQIRIPIEMCSRKHCELRVEGEELWLKDLGSSNGTFVNNERVGEVQLQAGDRITIGPVVLTVQIDGQPGDIAPTEAVDSSQDTSAGSGYGYDESAELEEGDYSDTIALNNDEENGNDEFVVGGGSDEYVGGAEGGGEDDPIAALEFLSEEEDENT